MEDESGPNFSIAYKFKEKQIPISDKLRTIYPKNVSDVKKVKHCNVKQG
jgi:hypothetical protein